MRVCDPQKKKKLGGQTPSQSMQLQTTAKTLVLYCRYCGHSLVWPINSRLHHHTVCTKIRKNCFRR